MIEKIWVLTMINPVQTAIPIPYAEIAAFCERHYITHLWLFGSVLREDFDAESDVDVLVKFDPDHIPGWEIVSMQDELASILGRHVDLGTPDGLRPWLQDKILGSARLIYERA